MAPELARQHRQSLQAPPVLRHEALGAQAQRVLQPQDAQTRTRPHRQEAHLLDPRTRAHPRSPGGGEQRAILCTVRHHLHLRIDQRDVDPHHRNGRASVLCDPRDRGRRCLWGCLLEHYLRGALAGNACCRADPRFTDGVPHLTASTASRRPVLRPTYPWPV